MTSADYLAALRQLYAAHGKELRLQPGASDTELDAAQQGSPFPLDAELRALWKTANGSTVEQTVFARPDFLTGYELLPVAGALDVRVSMRERSPAYANYEDPEPRDARLRPGWFQEGWLPFASFGGGTLLLLLDHSPSDQGQAGQIIAFTHDPDEMSYVAANWSELLTTSLAAITGDAEEFFSHDE